MEPLQYSCQTEVVVTILSIHTQVCIGALVTMQFVLVKFGQQLKMHFLQIGFKG